MKTKAVIKLCSKSFCFRYPNINDHEEIQKLIYKIQNLKSDVYFITLDHQINLKNILDVSSFKINTNELIRVTCYNADKQIAEKDSDIIKQIICKIKR